MNDKHLEILNRVTKKIYKNFQKSGDLYQLEHDIQQDFRELQVGVMDEALKAPGRVKKNANAEVH